jgi:hypothetical protein
MYQRNGAETTALMRRCWRLCDVEDSGVHKQQHLRSPRAHDRWEDGGREEGGCVRTGWAGGQRHTLAGAAAIGIYGHGLPSAGERR